VKSDFSVGANSFALLIRHGCTEKSLEATSNFFPGETGIDTIYGQWGSHCANEFAPTIEHKSFHTNRLHSFDFQA